MQSTGFQPPEDEAVNGSVNAPSQDLISADFTEECEEPIKTSSSIKVLLDGNDASHPATQNGIDHIQNGDDADKGKEYFEKLNLVKKNGIHRSLRKNFEGIPSYDQSLSISNSLTHEPDHNSVHKNVEHSASSLIKDSALPQIECKKEQDSCNVKDFGKSLDEVDGSTQAMKNEKGLTSELTENKEIIFNNCLVPNSNGKTCSSIVKSSFRSQQNSFDSIIPSANCEDRSHSFSLNNKINSNSSCHDLNLAVLKSPSRSSECENACKLPLSVDNLNLHNENTEGLKIVNCLPIRNGSSRTSLFSNTPDDSQNELMNDISNAVSSFLKTDNHEESLKYVDSTSKFSNEPLFSGNNSPQTDKHNDINFTTAFKILNIMQENNVESAQECLHFEDKETVLEDANNHKYPEEDIEGTKDDNGKECTSSIVNDPLLHVNNGDVKEVEIVQSICPPPFNDTPNDSNDGSQNFKPDVKDADLSKNVNCSVTSDTTEHNISLEEKDCVSLQNVEIYPKDINEVEKEDSADKKIRSDSVILDSVEHKDILVNGEQFLHTIVPEFCSQKYVALVLDRQCCYFSYSKSLPSVIKFNRTYEESSVDSSESNNHKNDFLCSLNIAPDSSKDSQTQVDIEFNDSVIKTEEESSTQIQEDDQRISNLSQTQVSLLNEKVESEENETFMTSNLFLELLEKQFKKLSGSCTLCPSSDGEQFEDLSVHVSENHICLSFIPVYQTDAFIHHVRERVDDVDVLYSDELYGNRFYICKECGDVFKSMNGVRLHLNDHQSVYAIQTGSSVDSCSCDRKIYLNQKKRWKKFIENNNFLCSFCNYRFACQSGLYNHLKLVHFLSETCQLCGIKVSGEDDVPLLHNFLHLNDKSNEDEYPLHNLPVSTDYGHFSWLALNSELNYLDGKSFRVNLMRKHNKLQASTRDYLTFPMKVDPVYATVPKHHLHSPSRLMSKYIRSKLEPKFKQVAGMETLSEGLEFHVQFLLNNKLSTKQRKSRSSVKKCPSMRMALSQYLGLDLPQRSRKKSLKSDAPASPVRRRYSRKVKLLKEEKTDDDEEESQILVVPSRTRSGMPKSDKEEENSEVEEPEEMPEESVSSAEVTGEWVNLHTFVCCSCGAVFLDLAEIMDHKWLAHPGVWCAHTMMQGQDTVPKCFQEQYVSPASLQAAIDVGVKGKSKKNSKKRFSCSHCKVEFQTIEEFHSHVIDCGGLNQVVPSKRKVKKGFRFHRRKGQGVPNRRYTSHSFTPIKNGSIEGVSGASTPHKDKNQSKVIRSSLNLVKQRLNLSMNSTKWKKVKGKVRNALRSRVRHQNKGSPNRAACKRKGLRIRRLINKKTSGGSPSKTDNSNIKPDPKKSPNNKRASPTEGKGKSKRSSEPTRKGTKQKKLNNRKSLLRSRTTELDRLKAYTERITRPNRIKLNTSNVKLKEVSVKLESISKSQLLENAIKNAKNIFSNSRLAKPRRNSQLGSGNLKKIIKKNSTVRSRSVSTEENTSTEEDKPKVISKRRNSSTNIKRPPSKESKRCSKNHEPKKEENDSLSEPEVVKDFRDHRASKGRRSSQSSGVNYSLRPSVNAKVDEVVNSEDQVKNDNTNTKMDDKVVETSSERGESVCKKEPVPVKLRDDDKSLSETNLIVDCKTQVKKIGFRKRHSICSLEDVKMKYNESKRVSNTKPSKVINRRNSENYLLNSPGQIQPVVKFSPSKPKELGNPESAEVAEVRPPATTVRKSVPRKRRRRICLLKSDEPELDSLSDLESVDQQEDSFKKYSLRARRNKILRRMKRPRRSTKIVSYDIDSHLSDGVEKIGNEDQALPEITLKVELENESSDIIKDVPNGSMAVKSKKSVKRKRKMSIDRKSVKLEHSERSENISVKSPEDEDANDAAIVSPDVDVPVKAKKRNGLKRKHVKSSEQSSSIFRNKRVLREAQLISYKSLPSDDSANETADELNTVDQIDDGLKSEDVTKKAVRRRPKKPVDENSPSLVHRSKRLGKTTSPVYVEDEVTYFCVKCGLTFDSVSSRDDHRQDCRNIELEMSLMADDYQYECPNCQMTFALKGTQRKHLASCRLRGRIRKQTVRRRKSEVTLPKESETIFEPPPLNGELLNSPDVPVTDSDDKERESIASRLSSCCYNQPAANHVCSLLLKLKLGTSDLRSLLTQSTVQNSMTILELNAPDGLYGESDCQDHDTIFQILDHPACHSLKSLLMESAESLHVHPSSESLQSKASTISIDCAQKDLLSSLSVVEELFNEFEVLQSITKKDEMILMMRSNFQAGTGS